SAATSVSLEVKTSSSTAPVEIVNRSPDAGCHTSPDCLSAVANSTEITGPPIRPRSARVERRRPVQERRVGQRGLPLTVGLRSFQLPHPPAEGDQQRLTGGHGEPVDVAE